MTPPHFPAIFAVLLLRAAVAAPAVVPYVDLLVVPAGPVALAEFESAAGGAPADPSTGSASPDGPGSGVRVKEADPATVPPSAIYLRKRNGGFYQIPCHLNSVGTPVRTPVETEEIQFMVRDGISGTSYIPIGKPIRPSIGSRILVLLTKPLNETKWTDPEVTLISLPRQRRAGAVVVNASQGAHCGLVIEGTQKILLPPLRHHAWSPPAGTSEPTVPVTLAMALQDGSFLTPFYDDLLPATGPTLSLIIAYDVTPRESFRGGKYVVSTLDADEFRPAEVVPPPSP